MFILKKTVEGKEKHEYHWNLSALYEINVVKVA
jgi:hypothetical protein